MMRQLVLYDVIVSWSMTCVSFSRGVGFGGVAEFPVFSVSKWQYGNCR